MKNWKTSTISVVLGIIIAVVAALPEIGIDPALVESLQKILGGVGALLVALGFNQAKDADK